MTTTTTTSPSMTFDVYPHGSVLPEDRPTKVVHFLRHAQGTHNVQKDYRSKKNMDAPLTDKGRHQCQTLAHRIQTASEDGPLYQLRQAAAEGNLLIITSPLQRCIQTATLALQPLLEQQQQQQQQTMVAHEMVRETVNYNCDRRRTLTNIAAEHNHVDYTHIQYPQDHIWQYYEERFGCDETYTKHRESGEIHVVAERGREFFMWLFQNSTPQQSSDPQQEQQQQQQQQQRQRQQQERQKHVVVCTHSAFLRCLKNYGNTDGTPEHPTGVPNLPPQHGDTPPDILPVLNYHGDETFANTMRNDYANCELRSCVIAVHQESKHVA